MYLISYGGRTVIHDGSVEGGAAAARQDNAVKIAYGHANKEGTDSEQNDGGRQGTRPPHPRRSAGTTAACR